MKYLVVLGLVLVGCSKPTPHRFAVGDCYFDDGNHVFTIAEIGKYGYLVKNSTTHTYVLQFKVEQLVEQVDCKFLKDINHERN